MSVEPTLEGIQFGAPLDFSFYFPGYAEGGMSGDYGHTAMGVVLYQRMPQLPSINTNTQIIPRMQLPQAIIEGKAEGYLWNGSSIEAQFTKITYPKPGFSPVHMLWKYGGSLIASPGCAAHRLGRCPTSGPRR